MTDHPFWNFSLAVYGKPGVADACIALQNRRGLDVNLLLFCCWAGSRGRALDAGDMARLIAAAGPWNVKVIRPLRAVRRWLKTQDGAPRDEAEALRTRIKAEELEAERLEQAILAATLAVGEGAPRADLAARNLTAYLAAVDRAPDGPDETNLAALLSGCFEDLTLAEAERLLS